jgi:hypothetical protein
VIPITGERLAELKDSCVERRDQSVFGDLPVGTVTHHGAWLPGNLASGFALTDEGDCPGCGGHVIDWSLAHGEAHCVGCGYPARVYHYFYVPAQGEMRIVKPLWYHPDFVEVER